LFATKEASFASKRLVRIEGGIVRNEGGIVRNERGIVRNGRSIVRNEGGIVRIRRHRSNEGGFPFQRGEVSFGQDEGIIRKDGGIAYKTQLFYGSPACIAGGGERKKSIFAAKMGNLG